MEVTAPSVTDAIAVAVMAGFKVLVAKTIVGGELGVQVQPSGNPEMDAAPVVVSTVKTAAVLKSDALHTGPVVVVETPTTVWTAPVQELATQGPPPRELAFKELPA